ncbi:hypothetical protein BGY98DRAFT_374765 [Russula aff. rugulosa BPL654]|nr:hypothetical protein BGY98DRAFT_374765 [Russula aff. rugulosa BPL654]
MSGLGNTLPPRDSSGRFIRRPDSPHHLPSADRSDQPDSAPLPIPSPALPRPSHLQRLIANPLEISDASSVPFSALVSRTTSLLNAPDSDSPDPHTPSPSPSSPNHPRTPVRRPISIWVDNHPPLLAPDFPALSPRDPEDSFSAAPPPQDLLFPELDLGIADSSFDTAPAPVKPRSPRNSFQLHPAFASATTLPLPALVPTITTANQPPTLQPPNIMSHSSSHRSHPNPGPAAMPSARSNRAPFFSGQVGDPIGEFLTEYEELADSCGLTNQQKVETIIRYIPLTHRDLWKSLEGYATHHWADFRLGLEDIYAGISAHSRHSKQKLYDFVKYASKTRMNEEEDVQRYYCRFMIFSKPLKDSQRLTDEECNKTFWLGFHPRDRRKCSLDSLPSTRTSPQAYISIIRMCTG